MATPAPNESLGPFVLEGPLGSGGMGRVLAARHRSGLAVAVKTLRADAYDEAFRAEVELIASLDHPHIVDVLAIGVAPPGRSDIAAGAPYLVMLRGQGTLASAVGQVPYPWLYQILLSLLDGLAHAHARGVIHCDIKPSNVLVGVRRNPRQPLAGPYDGLALADFGIAFRRGATHSSHGGTPGFRAPEQVDGDVANWGPWTDLYGLGALAFTLATGAPPDGQPFVARHPVPDRFEAWIRQLMAADPAHRPARALQAAVSLPHPSRVTSAPAGPLDVAPIELPTRPVLYTLTHFDAVSPPGTIAPAPDRPARGRPTPMVQGIPSSPLGTESTWRSPVLHDAGLGVWRLRTPPVVGRGKAQQQLWNWLRETVATRQTKTVLLTGPEGSGKRHLAQWLAWRAHEVAGAVDEGQPGLAVVACTVTEAPRLAHRPCTLVVMVSRNVPDTPFDHHIELGDLHVADLEDLARHSLSLEPELTARLAREAAGRPGRLVATLRRWADRGRLEPGPRGHRLRDTAIAEHLAAGQSHAARALLVRQARAQLRHGRVREAAATLADARQTALDGQGGRLIAEVDTLRLQLDASVWAEGEREAVIQALLGRVVAAGWADLEAQVRSRLGVDQSNQGHPEVGRAELEHALALADAAHLPEAQIAIRLQLGQVRLILGDRDGAAEVTRGMDPWVARHPRPVQASAARHLARALAALWSGDLDQTILQTSQAEALAVSGDFGLEAMKASRLLGTALTRAGRDQQAAEVWQRTIEHARDLGFTWDLPNLQSDLGDSLRKLGDAAGSERAHLAALSGLRDADRVDVVHRVRLAWLYLEQARLTEARSLVSPDVLPEASIGWPALRPQVWALRVAIAAADGRETDAREGLDALIRLRTHDHPFDPTTERALGLAVRGATDPHVQAAIQSVLDAWDDDTR